MPTPFECDEPTPQDAPDGAQVQPSPLPGVNRPPLYPFVAWRRGIEGQVTRGHGIGKQLLYPTANLAVHNRVLPADGVYVTLTLVDGVWRRSVTNSLIRY